MKKVRKMLSLLLAGVIAVTSLFCGAVTAGAESHPNYWINGVDGFYDNYYTVFLDGITQEEMSLVVKGMQTANSKQVTNIRGGVHIIFKDHELVAVLSVNENNEITGSATAFSGENKTDIAFWHIYLTANDGLTPISTTDDMPDNGTYCIGFSFDMNDSKQKQMIEKLQKYETADMAGFGLVVANEDGSVTYVGTYGGEWHIGSFFTINVPAYMDADSETTSKAISSLSFSSISSKAYTGKAIKPSVTVKDGTKTLVKGTDYTLSYKNNKNIGTATVTITGKGSYTGTKSLTFKIIPAKATLTAKKSNGKYALSWKKVTGITKYQIQYSTDSGKTYKTAGTVSSGKTSAALKLDTSKSYTFRIRSYKTVDGKKYYSSWSKTVTVK
ncbi:MAG: fibronectin type III domain-containing protein [Ruminiclostridium sp.]|nr:fibronectin type III domain-containing protein [Ruminiclostridium sp.]